jgi:acetyl esterase/lipase
MKRIATIVSILFIGVLFVTDGISQNTKTEAKVTYKTEQNILYRDTSSPGWDAYMEERCQMDMYYPSNSPGFATVVWFHGGGLRGGERYIPEELMNQGIAVVAPNYRMHPKVNAPVYIEDAAAAVAWVFENIQRFGGSAEKIFVSGHSAGGYLASMVGLDKQWLAVHDINANRIAGLLPFSGQAVTHSTVRLEQGIPDGQPHIDKYAPLVHVRADAPPMVLITGDRNLELPARYEENAYMLAMMKDAGHEHTTLYEMPGFTHGTMRIPGYQIMLEQIRKIAGQ